MKKKKSFNRYNFMIVVMVLIFSAIVTRLIYIQIINHENYKEEANSSSVRQIVDTAPRGMILDKNGAVLAKSEQSYMVVFNETEENNKFIFDTLRDTFKLLDETGETLVDDLAVKINPYRFEFNSSDPDTRKAMERRFKIDRGLDDVIKKKLYPNQKDELTDDQKTAINEAMMEITPEEVFDKLIIDYELYRMVGLTSDDIKKQKITGADVKEMLLKKYSLEEVRKYIVVRDAMKMQRFTGYKPVVIASDIKKESSLIFMQKASVLPGIDVVMQPTRVYPYKDLASAVIGYLGSISTDQKDKYEERGYDVSTDMIGKNGIESAFEDRLRGRKGGNVVKVNSQGKKTEELFSLAASPGQNVQLTIDKDVQYTAEQSLKEVMSSLQSRGRLGDGLNVKNANRGAVVVENVNTGEIISMVSLPSYDPNLFATSGKLTTEQVETYFSPNLEKFGKEYIKKMGLPENTVISEAGVNENTLDYIFPVDDNFKDGSVRKDPFDVYPKYTFNYATQGLVAPGSTFKILTAIAGLEEGVVDENTIVNDVGIFNKYDDIKTFKGADDIYNSSGQTHGPTDMRKAIAVSCNYYFFEVGYRLQQQFGLDIIARYAWKFGFGSKEGTDSTTGIEITENPMGQTFSYDKIKRAVAATSKYDVVRILNDGYYAGYRFTSLDIGKKDGDSKDIANGKEAIKSAVREKLLSDIDDKRKGEEHKVFTQDLQGLISNYINLLSDEEKSKYSKKDIESMSFALGQYVVFDKRTEIITPANILNTAIGQGINEYTPLQMVNFMSTVANGGKRYETHLVDKILNSNGEVVEDIKPRLIEDVGISQKTLQIVKDGMSATTNDGTARYAFQGFPMRTAGKTGSATFREGGVQEAVGRTSYAEYTGFAPVDNPEIAITVVIYDGGHGGEAANVARAVYESYFKERLQKEYPGYTPRFNYELPAAQ